MLHNLLNKCVIACVDEILIYSETEAEHIALIKRVLQRLREVCLCLSIKMSQFHRKKEKYLRDEISQTSISMTQVKVQSVRNLPCIKNVKVIEGFRRFVNFHRSVIERFNRKCKPLTDLPKNDTPFVSTENCYQSRNLRKDCYSYVLILTHFDTGWVTQLKTDASNFATSSILSQLNPKTNC